MQHKHNPNSSTSTSAPADDGEALMLGPITAEDIDGAVAVDPDELVRWFETGENPPPQLDAINPFKTPQLPVLAALAPYSPPSWRPCGACLRDGHP